jgi:iron-sulfur cluster repair protein YtfE (RIC family)
MIVRVEELFNAIGQELLTHMLKEEQVLFLH